MLNNGQYLWRVTGDDINNFRRGKSSRGETAFYSAVFIAGILALGVVWS